MLRILVIDDDAVLAGMLSQYLIGDGYKPTVASDGESGLQLVRERCFDAIILDIMLPGMTGLDVLRQLREFSPVPIIMLTAKGSDEDRILGLELGADDYLAKPFNPKELIARMRAVARRQSLMYRMPRGVMVFGELVLTPLERLARWKGQELSLTAVEFSFLEAIVNAGGEVKTRDELSKLVLGRRHHAYDRTVDVHISNLRKKLSACCQTEIIIESVRGHGYRLKARK